MLNKGMQAYRIGFLHIGKTESVSEEKDRKIKRVNVICVILRIEYKNDKNTAIEQGCLRMQPYRGALWCYINSW